jgi:hypothetical protein
MGLMEANPGDVCITPIADMKRFRFWGTVLLPYNSNAVIAASGGGNADLSMTIV